MSIKLKTILALPALAVASFAAVANQGQGDGLPIADRVTVSGKAEVNFRYIDQVAGLDQSSSDIVLDELDLKFDVMINDFVNAVIGFNNEQETDFDPVTGRVDVVNDFNVIIEEAFIHMAYAPELQHPHVNADFFARIGRQFVPFGNGMSDTKYTYSGLKVPGAGGEGSFFVTDTFTKSSSEMIGDAGRVGLASDINEHVDLYFSVYAMRAPNLNNVVRESTDQDLELDTFGATLGAQGGEVTGTNNNDYEGVAYQVQIGYVTNPAAANFIGSAANMGDTFHDGLALSGAVQAGPVALLGEYVAVLNEYAPGTFGAGQTEAKTPTSVTAELAYLFDFHEQNHSVGFTYQFNQDTNFATTSGAGYFFNPSDPSGALIENRYGAVANLGIYDNVIFSLEYLLGQSFENDDESRVTAGFKVNF